MPLLTGKHPRLLAFSTFPQEIPHKLSLIRPCLVVKPGTDVRFQERHHVCTFVYKRPVEEISREGRRPHDYRHSALFCVERGREVRRLEELFIRFEREDDRKRG